MAPLFLARILRDRNNFEKYNTAIVFILILIITVFLAMIARNIGKKEENKMVEELGGYPTSLILMNSDKHINMKTKNRYKKKLHAFTKDKGLDINLESDEIEEYDVAIDFLRVKVNSNIKKFKNVYNELVSYNYWRNLYALKKFNISIYSIMFLFELVRLKNKNIFCLLLDNDIEAYPILIYTITIIIVILILNKKTVHDKAFDYAKALVETIEIM